MSLLVKENGAWVPIDSIRHKESGSWNEIATAYHKEAGSWVEIYRNTIFFTLATDNDVNLAQKLAGFKDGSNIEVTIPANAVIGGSRYGYASLDMGDISRFKWVHINLFGEIQGLGGQGGAWGLNRYKHGSHCIFSEHPFSIHIHSTGKIRAGGGAGGNGGKGGPGEYVNYGAWRDAWTTTVAENRSRWDQTENNQAAKILWDDAEVYYKLNHGYVPEGQYDYAYAAPYWYQRATTFRFESRFWNIRRGLLTDSVGGAGGNGGNGQGFGQNSSLGANGVSGVNNAGDGGKGGNGSSWAVNGAGGVDGTDGNVSGGYPGESGGIRGYSIYAPNKTVYVKNEGLKQGRESFVWRPYVE